MDGRADHQATGTKSFVLDPDSGAVHVLVNGNAEGGGEPPLLRASAGRWLDVEDASRDRSMRGHHPARRVRRHARRRVQGRLRRRGADADATVGPSAARAGCPDRSTRARWPRTFRRRESRDEGHRAGARGLHFHAATGRRQDATSPALTARWRRSAPRATTVRRAMAFTRRRRWAGAQVSPGRDEAVLDRVSRELVVPKDQVGRRVQPRDGHAGELGEGVMIAVPRSNHESSLVHTVSKEGATGLDASHGMSRRQRERFRGREREGFGGSSGPDTASVATEIRTNGLPDSGPAVVHSAHRDRPGDSGSRRRRSPGCSVERIHPCSRSARCRPVRAG